MGAKINEENQRESKREEERWRNINKWASAVKKECTYEEDKEWLDRPSDVKDKSDVQSCDCSGIKLMNHSMKIWERAVEGRLRREVISEQYDFVLRKRITDVMFG